MNIETIRNLINSTKGRFFTVEFEKKNGEVRVMNARLGVKKHLKTGDPSTTAHIPKYVTVFDTVKGNYRNINLETIRALNIDGVEMKFV